MRFAAVCVFMVLGFSINCFAADSEATGLAKRVMAATGVKQGYADALNAVVYAKVDGISAAEHAKRAKVAMARVSFEKAEPVYLDAFTKTFTVAELKQIVTFLESPIGRKYASNLLPVHKQVSATVQPWFVSARRYMMEGR
ncbi:MAG: DUF2059 domain-containing protein [Bdellovibrionota bacterium]